MKRISGMIRFHLKRNYKPVLIFFACLTAIILIVTVYYSKDNQSTILLDYGGGGTFYGLPVDDTASQSYGYYSSYMAIDTDYSSPFIILAFVLAIRMMLAERRYLTAIGSTRWETLAAHAASVFIISVSLSLLSSLITVMARAMLMAFGFRFREGWSARTLLFGAGTFDMKPFLMVLTSMLCRCGIFTLLTALCQRWWKILLVLGGTGFVLAVVLVLQISFDTVNADTIATIEKIIVWMEEDLIPFIDKWFVDISDGSIMLRRIVIGLGCTALTYPVIVGTKLK